MPDIPRPLRVLLIAFSLLAVAAFLFTALARITYPYELEYMTGACLDHVHRILAGEKVYVEPTPDFVTWLYGPLYFYTCALVSWVAGEASLMIQRIVSLSSAITTTLLALMIVRRATGEWLPGLAAAGLWASTYGIVGTWWDIGRVDSMFVALTTGVLGILWFGKSNRSAILAGVLMTVAYMAKQTALVVAPPFCIAAAMHSFPRALRFGAAFAITLVPSVLVLDWIHDGWFQYYTFDIPRSHGYAFSDWWKFFPGDMLAIAPMLAAATWYIVRLFATHRTKQALFHGAWCGGLFVATQLSRAHPGGAENVVIPTHLGSAVLAALALAEAARDRAWRIPIAVVVAAQFAFSAYNPWHYLPTEADRAVGNKLMRILEETEGPVMMPLHGHWLHRTGHPAGAHVLAVMDVERGPDSGVGEQLRADFLRFTWDRDIEMLILNEPGAEDFGQLLVRDATKIEWDLEELYPRELNPDGSLKVQAENGRPLFMPVVGLQTRPRQIWRRKR